MAEPIYATTGEVFASAMFVILIIFIFTLAFLRPTHEAVKRIEAMQPCSQQSR